VSNIPTEVVRSWVGQNVTALAHSAGVPATPAISTPEVPRGTRKLRRPGVTQGPPWPHWARGNRGRYSVMLEDLSGSLNDTSSFGTTITSEVGSVAFFPWHAVLRIVLALRHGRPG
jgi:hypothetical protein